jgi:hypothetical protein
MVLSASSPRDSAYFTSVSTTACAAHLSPDVYYAGACYNCRDRDHACDR